MSQANLPHLRRQPLPTMYDLPSETVGEPALPDEFHRFQADLMEETCQPPTYSPDQIFIACDLYLYYDSRHPLWYKRPDWFLAVDVPRASQQQDLRLSYVIWQEGVPPFMVLELLSPGTEEGCTRYQAVTLPQHRLWIEELQLGLGLWLRWYDAAGEWVPTAQERAEQEHLRAE
ncbi:MAG: Uma2 family endonuclease [Cyanobacteriota bacterium SKYGB_h_bin112]|nr:Uma2 family endonuclease [Cyanobacteriota bacterium SKYGB_h_bin112]